MNYSHNKDVGMINNINNSLIKKRSSSNSHLEEFKSNSKTDLSLQPSNSLKKQNFSDRLNVFSKKNQPITPNYPPNLNMTPLSFISSNRDSVYTFTENIHVFLRVRPLNNLELSRGDSRCLEIANQQMVFLNNKLVSKNYSFDYVFGEKSTQEDVFQNSQMNVN